jgi:hypothetical protein
MSGACTYEQQDNQQLLPLHEACTGMTMQQHSWPAQSCMSVVMPVPDVTAVVVEPIQELLMAEMSENRRHSAAAN